VRAPRLSENELASRGIRAAEDLGRDDPLWPGQVAMAAAIVLALLLPSKLAIGPKWLVPAAEGLLFAGLFVPALLRGPNFTRFAHEIVLGVLLLATVTSLVSLGLLSHYLFTGGKARGVDLISGGSVIWITDLFIFTVWYWVLDRGGPVKPAVERVPVAPDFLFPQMTDDRYAAPGWKPRFGDYLYTSLTNQTAFSPTDTMPLSLRAKALMGVQGVAALITVGVIVARAVNILA
jgi:hypothetical protein